MLLGTVHVRFEPRVGQDAACCPVLHAPYARVIDLVTHSRLKQISLTKLFLLNRL